MPPTRTSTTSALATDPAPPRSCQACRGNNTNSSANCALALAPLLVDGNMEPRNHAQSAALRTPWLEEGRPLSTCSSALTRASRHSALSTRMCRPLPLSGQPQSAPSSTLPYSSPCALALLTAANLLLPLLPLRHLATTSNSSSKLYVVRRSFFFRPSFVVFIIIISASSSFFFTVTRQPQCLDRHSIFVLLSS